MVKDFTPVATEPEVELVPENDEAMFARRASTAAVGAQRTLDPAPHAVATVPSCAREIVKVAPDVAVTEQISGG